MFRLFCIAAASALLMSPDVYQATHLQPPEPAPLEIPPGLTIPVLPNFSSGLTPGQTPAPEPSANPSTDSGSNSSSNPSSNQSANPQASAAAAPRTVKDQPLQEQSRLAIMRNVDGEFARMVTSVPGGRKGFRMAAGEPLNRYELDKAIRAAGASLNSGDDVQITKVAFLAHEIEVDLNGGGRGTRLRDHLQYGVGIAVPIQTSTTTTPEDRGPAAPPKKVGATLYIDFGRPVPDMTPDQVKAYLNAVLDFSRQRSASVQWVSTLPAKVQEAIADKRPDVGMDREEILAAMGRPDRKVREQDQDGNDTEDWIYGYPPAKTVFVRFIGDKVVKVDQYQ